MQVQVAVGAAGRRRPARSTSTPGPTRRRRRAAGPGTPPACSPPTPRRPGADARRAGRRPGATPVDLDDALPGAGRRRLGYGPAFQGLRGAWRAATTSSPRSRCPRARRRRRGFGLHPALLDAALHAVTARWSADGDGPAAVLLVGVALHATGATALRVRLTPAGPDR